MALPVPASRGGALTSLAEILAALEREIADTGKLHFVNTRLILTVGINLRHFSPEENTDPRRVALAVKSLTMMGLLGGAGDKHGV